MAVFMSRRLRVPPFPLCPVLAIKANMPMAINLQSLKVSISIWMKCLAHLSTIFFFRTCIATHAAAESAVLVAFAAAVAAVAAAGCCVAVLFLAPYVFVLDRCLDSADSFLG